MKLCCDYGGSVVKNPFANAGDERCPRVEKISWIRKWQPTPVFLPGKADGQRNVAGYGPKGRKELDKTEGLSTHRLHVFKVYSLMSLTCTSVKCHHNQDTELHLSNNSRRPFCISPSSSPLPVRLLLCQSCTARRTTSR